MIREDASSHLNVSTYLAQVAFYGPLNINSIAAAKNNYCPV
jgi:hypothetical protein